MAYHGVGFAIPTVIPAKDALVQTPAGTNLPPSPCRRPPPPLGEVPAKRAVGVYRFDDDPTCRAFRALSFPRVRAAEGEKAPEPRRTTPPLWGRCPRSGR